MRSLDNISIAFKFIIIISFVSLIGVIIALISINNLKSLSVATNQIELSGSEMKLASRLNQDALELNRAEYRVALNPDSIDEVTDVISGTLRDMDRRLTDAMETAGPEQKQMLARIESARQDYVRQLEHTTEIAAEMAGSIELSAAQMKLLNSVRENRDNVAALRDAVSDYVNYTDEKGASISQSASVTAEQGIAFVSIVAVLGILTGLGLSIVLSRSAIVAPLRRVLSSIKQLSAGKLDVDVGETARRDEIGDIARATLDFKKSLQRSRELEEENERKEAQAEERRKREMQELADSFEASVGEVVEFVSSAATELQASAEQLSAVAEETNAQCGAVAAAGAQFEANVQNVSSAAEQLSSSISEINRQINTANDQTRTAAGAAADTRKTMSHLRDHVEKIGAVVDLIQDISAQTNLLALNATIEAARAGEAGKGFAVVASEVKTLATQTGSATEDISGKIEQIEEAAKQAITAVEEIASMIESIDENTTGIAGAVEEQGAATDEIARNSQQASTGTGEVTSQVQSINDAASETGTMSQQVLSASAELNQKADMLKSEVKSFVARVRAA